ncbi:MAG: NUDIX hydrolase [bacterium]|nr:NUDIX hydrolase [bacterium]
MPYRLFGGLWLALPPGLRRFVLRRVQTTFTVSAAAVVVNIERKVLVLHHVLRPNTGWGLPGGFVDAGEQPHIAIARELMEETGIEITDIKMLHLKTLGRHVEILFAAKAIEEGKILSSEIDHLGWYAFDEIPERLPMDQRLTIERVLKGEI